MLKVAQLEVYKSPKIKTISEISAIARQKQKLDQKIGLCHGGFDLLHPGHVKHFESAKKICDVLIVSVTSDKFVSIRKGEDRPIFTDKLRAYMIAHIDCVDYVVISDFQRGTDVINLIQPDFYIKGPDLIGKDTPGITAEREAINAVGGRMEYTTDPKLSTTEIISYIQSIKPKKLLLVLDRDGTLIPDEKFLGKEKDWKKQIRLNHDVVNFILYLQTKFPTTKIVVTNQSGVARGYFSENTVRQVNQEIAELLKEKKVTIDNWQYCPDIDRSFVKQNPGIRVRKRYIKEKTTRKPSPDMVVSGLKEIGKNQADFDRILVLGDRTEEDGGLARNLEAEFINIKGVNYESLVRKSVKMLGL